MVAELNSWLTSLGRWVNGLVGGFIAAASNSIAVIAADPDHFSPFAPGALKRLGVVAIVSGIIGAALFLRQQPTPWNGTDRRTANLSSAKDSIGQ